MFDFVGDYINWATSDGWSSSALALLALGGFAVAFVALAVLVAALSAARWFIEGIRVGMSDDPTSTRELFKEKRAAERAQFEEAD